MRSPITAADRPFFFVRAVTPEQQAWVASLLAEARTKRDLPALADPHALLLDETAMDNTFTAQPQQRNLQGRIFGGFLMRRAFELAHSAAYLFSAARPRTVTVDEIQFRAPVNVGDLLRFRSWVLRTWLDEDDPSKVGWERKLLCLLWAGPPCPRARSARSRRPRGRTPVLRPYPPLRRRCCTCRCRRR
jgi:acyl-coenzyme A thioesterase PaaI-like protein